MVFVWCSVVRFIMYPLCTLDTLSRCRFGNLMLLKMQLHHKMSKISCILKTGSKLTDCLTRLQRMLFIVVDVVAAEVYGLNESSLLDELKIAPAGVIWRIRLTDTINECMLCIRKPSERYYALLFF